MLSSPKRAEQTFRIIYRGTEKSIVQNVKQNNVVNFNTVNVKINLIDSAGNPINEGGTVKYYASGWKDFGAANTSLELLPSNKYTFKMFYKGGYVSQRPDVTESTELTFQTGLVKLNLTEGPMKYYTHKWYQFDGEGEFLPEIVHVQFRVPNGTTKTVKVEPIPGETLTINTNDFN